MLIAQLYILRCGKVVYYWNEHVSPDVESGSAMHFPYFISFSSWRKYTVVFWSQPVSSIRCEDSGHVERCCRMLHKSFRFNISQYLLSRHIDDNGFYYFLCITLVVSCVLIIERLNTRQWYLCISVVMG